MFRTAFLKKCINWSMMVSFLSGRVIRQITYYSYLSIEQYITIKFLNVCLKGLSF